MTYTRSSLALSLTAFVSLFPLVGAGCASETGADPSSEEVAASQDELAAAASQLVGSYFTHAIIPHGFARLELKANGKYTAQLDPAGAIVCVISPCLLPESGTWSASKVGGAFRLRLHPAGGAIRVYDAVKGGSGGSTLLLSANGKSQKLSKLGKSQCLDDSNCSAVEECAVRACFMACALTDPLCCGPSTCVPKAAPPPPPKMCGGFAGIPCGANEICVDDPTDSCDPTKGGADCSGICQPK